MATRLMAQALGEVGFFSVHRLTGSSQEALVGLSSRHYAGDGRKRMIKVSRGSPRGFVQRRSSLTSCVASAVAENATSIEIEIYDSSRPTPAELARTLVQMSSEGSLSTLSNQGWPLGSHVFYAVDAEGRPVFQIQNNSLVAENLRRDSRCSLHVQVELPGKQKPNCTLRGQMFHSADNMSKLRLETSWRTRFPASGLEDASYYWMEIEDVYVSSDTDEEPSLVSGVSFKASEADPLRDCATEIVEDVNREHWEDLQRMCRVNGGFLQEVDEASMLWVDKLGFDLRVLTRATNQLQDIRIQFPRPIVDEREARSTITMMAQVAWESEKNYSPQPIPSS